jgi:hypothetical protein
MVQNHRGVGFCCFERKREGDKKKEGERESKNCPLWSFSDSPVLGGYLIFLITVSSDFKFLNKNKIKIIIIIEGFSELQNSRLSCF